MKAFPSSKEIIKEAKSYNKKADINQLHAIAFDVMKKYRDIYYQNKVKDLLHRPSLANLPPKIIRKIKEELLKPIPIGNKLYSNFMEEASRRISQTFQVISGNVAELCVEEELKSIRLVQKVNYEKKKEHTDFIIYHPKKINYLKRHRVEVKNVALRERATRGLAFDGDSLIGFFNDASEFTSSQIDEIDQQCRKTDGYCYIPPTIIKKLGVKLKNKRFKSNKNFASDMRRFADKGLI